MLSPSSRPPARRRWRLAQLYPNEDTPAAAHLPAYLHRKECDATNVTYCYARAGVSVCTDSLEDEWTALFQSLH